MKRGVKRFDISWKLYSLIVGALIVLGLAGFGYAYGGNSPSIHGHDAGEIMGDTGSSIQYKIIHGIVSADGTKLRGTGFTSVRYGAGLYRITFNEPFDELPTVVISHSGTGPDTEVVVSAELNEVTIRQHQNGAGDLDAAFNFIAVAG